MQHHFQKTASGELQHALFGTRFMSSAVAASHGIMEVEANTKSVQILAFHTGSGSLRQIWLHQVAATVMTTTDRTSTDAECAHYRDPADTKDAIVRVGQVLSSTLNPSTGDEGNMARFYIQAAEQGVGWNTALQNVPVVITPGNILLIANAVANDATDLSVMWVEF